ncbi:30S ribosomal protein S7 [Candidatus Legionella polyplacis]|uniref:Small ribosomal subunit protein uS7 n=1 Tax=Candidatus Legionella polyplacis TaxID=2005262 RepID=A0ABZ2H0P4_9GAMM|nr:30S ribosomal protein S7 [Candidatus Legionella polyplacis]ATW01768.1 30S ribosomal protein S7 [Candidatus Legionella polyplacis]
MSRKKNVLKRKILSDPKYNSQLLAKFINVLMINGKKTISERIIYNSMQLLYNSVGKDIINSSEEKYKILSCFEKAINNVRPSVEVRSRRVGGATYQVPVEVCLNRSLALAMRWIIKFSRSRSEKGMTLRLAGELIDAFKNRGLSIKKRDDTHKMANANKAFAHFRWN